MIYIIDDDQHIRRGFGMLFKSAGFEYCSYGSAEEFLEKSKPTGSDILILDYHLPGMSGCDLLDHFTKIKLYISVILITAFDDQVSRDSAKKYGALAYLRKPVDGDALVDLIKFSFN
jgi:FixJ family two-component response regulator